METRYTSKFDTIDIALFVIGLLCVVTPLSQWFNNSEFTTTNAVFLVFGIVVIAGAFLRSNKAFYDAKTLVRRICRELDAQNRKYIIQDDNLFVVDNKNTFRVQIGDTSNRRVKRLCLIYDFKDERRENISKEGWTVAANRINTDNPRVTFVIFEESYQCRLETAISNAKDFIPEFDVAYSIIAEAVDEFNRIYPYLERENIYTLL